MATARVNPTRMELTRQKKRLVTATRGHKLLKDKRDEMVRRLVIIARENKALREQVEKALTKALYDFMLARAVLSTENMDQALLVPAREVEIKTGKRNIMSVNVPSIEVSEIREQKNGYPYGFAFTTSELDSAITNLAEVLPLLIKLAETEKTCSMLAIEIEKTRRRANALEYVLIPQMQETVKSITMKLEENERGNLTRLMKVKDMQQKKEATAG